VKADAIRFRAGTKGLALQGNTMSATVVTLWLLNILLDTFGQLSFKAAATAPDLGDGLARWKAMARRPWIWCGIAAYVGEFLAWLAFLSLLPLSEGVLLGSINIVAVMIAGRVLFNETLSPLRTLGILLVAGGVAVVGLA
jgi:drug/metabolite transporter (DMT)-like permease